ncbi:hypothetical protein S40288_11785, partial [Stachybotrys chartarum IBT 40288]
RINYLLTL